MGANEKVINVPAALRSGDIKNVLVINLGGVGDMLLSTPALRAIKNTRADIDISVLVDPRVGGIAGTLPYLGRIYTIYTGLDGVCRPSRVLHNLKTIFLLRRRRFDLAVNMRTVTSRLGALKIRMLLSAIGARYTAGRDTDGRGGFFDVKIDEDLPGGRYEMEYDIELAERLGASVADRKIDYIISAEGSKKAQKILSGAGIGEKAIVIGVHPGGKESHRWPLENFAAAISRISARCAGRALFVITGTADERPLGVSLAHMSGVKTVNAAGELEIDEIGALVKKCSVFITNDTAIMHIAALLDVPTVAIFGPGFVKRFDPRRLCARAEVIYKGAPCAPCNRHRCAVLDCLKNIKPDEVAESALGMLRKERII